MERGEDEVAGLRRGQRGPDRLEVAHLAEEDHVGVLAQRAAESLGEADRVRAELALVDDALLVLVQELDRVLDRDDVVGPVAVDLVDERRERRRLTRAGRARDEDEPARLVAEAIEGVRDAEFFEGLQLGGNKAERAREALPLRKDVHTKPGDARNRVERSICRFSSSCFCCSVDRIR